MDSRFMTYFGCISELNRMLGMRFIWDGNEYRSMGIETPIGMSIVMVGVFHNRQEYAQRDVEIAKVAMLVKHLQEIEKHDKDLLKEFRRKLHDTSKNSGTYFGTRMEINIAASLIRKRIVFKKTESPDFTIGEYGVYLECTSIHQLDDSSANLIDKIRSAIFEKSKKVYSNLATVLCVDITNVSAKNVESEQELRGSKDALKEAVKQMLLDTNSNYGSVLLFSYFMDSKGAFSSIYNRIDNESAKPALSGFLDKYFPLGEYNTGPGWIPKAG